MNKFTFGAGYPTRRPAPSSYNQQNIDVTQKLKALHEVYKNDKNSRPAEAPVQPRQNLSSPTDTNFTDA